MKEKVDAKREAIEKITMIPLDTSARKNENSF